MTLLTKAILAIILVLLAIINFVTMMEVMGRTKPRSNAKALRLIHRFSGACFIVLLLVLIYVGGTFLKAFGGEPSPRVALHALLAVAALLTLCFKVSFVRFYKKYFSSAVPLGVLLVGLTAGTAAMSAGYYFVVLRGKPPAISAQTTQKSTGAALEGVALFKKKCANCHFADKKETKIGPGLKDLFKMDKLPSTGRPVTEENIQKQIRTPIGEMPAFPKLSGEQIDSLVRYLKSQ